MAQPLYIAFRYVAIVARATVFAPAESLLLSSKVRRANDVPKRGRFGRLERPPSVIGLYGFAGASFIVAANMATRILGYLVLDAMVSHSGAVPFGTRRVNHNAAYAKY